MTLKVTSTMPFIALSLSPVLFCAVPGISNDSFTNYSRFVVDYSGITPNIFFLVSEQLYDGASSSL